MLNALQVFSGKWIFIHVLRASLEGYYSSIDAIAEQLKVNGFAGAIVKINDGRAKYNLRRITKTLPYKYDDGYLPLLVPAFKSRNLKIAGMQWTYGINPVGEADSFADRLLYFGFDGAVVNSEAPMKDKRTEMILYGARLRSRVGSIMPIVDTTFKWPSVHIVPDKTTKKGVFPFKELFAFTDGHIPQVYWPGYKFSKRIEDRTVTGQLMRSLAEYHAYDTKPIFPALAAYSEHGFTATAAELDEAHQAALLNCVPGFSYWELWNANRVGLMQTLLTQAI